MVEAQLDLHAGAPDRLDKRGELVQTYRRRQRFRLVRLPEQTQDAPQVAQRIPAGGSDRE
ncbi:MAG: hypothetical protein DLM66_10730 [Candidatus Dormiibacter spiritus]|nr:MAG: hypothetical protein DLM66_10730 [Candidatus Dormibacteraeota bacterium]